MLRTALLLFTAVILLLVALALQPPRPVEVPDSRVLLRDTQVALYPRADPEAAWYFASPHVDYSPDSGESVLHALSDGRRTVGGETDFTLAAETLTIDQSENLRGDLILARLERTGECLTMLASGPDPVLIDQGAGRFMVPLMRIDGPSWGSDNQWQRVQASFDLVQFTAGGPGTATVNEFLADARAAEPGSTPCDT